MKQTLVITTAKFVFALGAIVIACNVPELYSTRHEEVAWIARDQLSQQPCCRPDEKVRAQVVDAWERIEAQLKRLRPDYLEGLNEPATEQQVAELERQLGFPLPYDVRCSLLVHNGGGSGLFYELYSVDQILDRYFAWSGYPCDMHETIYNDMPRMRGDFCVQWQPDSVPVGNCANIFDIWVELATGEMPHWFEGYEAETSANFGAWLKHLADALEAGNYVKDEQGRFDYMMLEF